MSALWTWLVKRFTREKVGVLFRILFQSGTSAVATQIADLDLNRKALEFVKELAQRDDLTSAAKAQLFNKKMIEYGKLLGKTFGESVINCLRELAVNALKVQLGN